MKKRCTAILLSLMLAFGIFGACSKPAESTAKASSKAEESTSTAAEAEESKATGEEVVITFGYLGDSGETEAYKKAIEGVEEAIPGVKVELSHYAGVADFWDNLPGQIAAGTAPDIMAPTNEGHLSFIKEELFAPLDGYNFDMSNFTPGAVDAWTYDGKLYGIPTTAAPGVFIINKDMWDAAGLKDMPTTWDEVYEAAKALTKGEVKGLCIDFSQGYHPTQYMNSYGGGWKNGADINSKANVEAFDYIFKMYEEGLAINPKDVGLSWDGEVFAANKCAMSTGGTWYIGMMKESAPDVNYEIISMPGGNGQKGCTLHTTAFTVLSSSKNVDIAAQVAYYMAREEAQKATGEIVGNMPSMISLRDWYFDTNPEMKNARESLDWATSFGYPVQAAEFQTDLVRGFEGVVYANDGNTSQGILDELAEKYGTK